MGGSNRQTNHSTQNTNQSQTSTAPGTAFGTALLPQGTNFANQNASSTPFTGNRVQAPTRLEDYVAQWGDIPDTFVPQRTATDAPIQVAQTHVDPNAQEGIDAGLAAAGQNQAGLAPIVSNMYDYWNQISAGGGQNPFLEPVIDSFTTDFDERSARAAGQRALYAGAEGAFGGTPFGQNETWSAEQEAQAYAQAVGGIRYQDFLNTQGMMQSAPGQLGNIAALNAVPAEQFARYGGMRQENLSAAAAMGDRNAQALQNNLWQAMSLNDSNAVLAAQEAIAQWEAAHMTEDANVRNQVAGAAVDQQIGQAGLDNQFLAWLNSQETLANQINNWRNIIGGGASIPGGTQTGNSQTTSTSTTEQETPLWQQLAGLAGAGMQAFAPGGFFAGSLAGGAGAAAGAAGAGAAAGGAAGASSLLPLLAAFSDRLLKKDIKYSHKDNHGIKWYWFRYIWDEDNSELRFGVMADEVPSSFVSEGPGGYKMVDYGALSEWEKSDAMAY